jgi:hypothetical protein
VAAEYAYRTKNYNVRRLTSYMVATGIPHPSISRTSVTGWNSAFSWECSHTFSLSIPSLPLDASTVHMTRDLLHEVTVRHWELISLIRVSCQLLLSAYLRYKCLEATLELSQSLSRSHPSTFSRTRSVIRVQAHCRLTILLTSDSDQVRRTHPFCSQGTNRHTHPESLAVKNLLSSAGITT